MKEMTVSPIVLSDVLSFPATFPQPDMPIVPRSLDQLKNPSRTPFLVDEIRFRVSTLNNYVFPGMLTALRVRLDLGRLQLTAGRFVPVSLLAPSLDSATELASGIDASFRSYAPYFVPFFSIGVGYDGHSFIWRLPKPLYIPAGETIFPQFMLDSTATGNPSTAFLMVAISYVGRALPSDAPVPEYVNVPFVNAWIDSKRVGGAKYAVRSIRSDLKNPHGEPLFIQRMLGNYLYQDATSIAPSGVAVSPMGVGAVTATITAFTTDADLIGNDLVTARIVKSNGRIVARDAAPWNHLFPWSTRAFDVCAVLRRNEYYQITSDIDLSGRPAADNITLMASIVGYRKVAYAGASYFSEVG